MSDHSIAYESCIVRNNWKGKGPDAEGSINFLWMMAANREGVDRKFGVGNIQLDW
jgi:hypothetical protein